MYVYNGISNQLPNQLKADRLHPCNYPHMPTDYRHTDKHLRLVLLLLLVALHGKAEPLILTTAWQKFDLDP